jgi:hypothetical protein
MLTKTTISIWQQLNVGGGEYLEVGRVEEDPDGTDVGPAAVHPLPEQEQSIF